MADTDKAALFDADVKPGPKSTTRGPAAGARGMYGHGAQGLNSPLITAIINGTLAIEIDPEDILDEVESDRIGNDWKHDDDMSSLIENIRSRGQQQPIRVRPADVNWKPNPRAPLSFAGTEFLLQSGRRRLYAVNALNEELPEGEKRKILAVISTPKGDKELADLEERFSENTIRKNLNAFEKLRSIGQISLRRKDRNQRENADDLGVSQALIPPAQIIAEFEELIRENIDVSKASMNSLRALATKIREGYRFEEGDATEVITKITAIREPGLVKVSNGVVIKKGRGSKLEVSLEDGSKLTSDQMEWVLEAIASGVGRIGKMKM